ncbi:MAG: hypothetical protein Q9195_003365 [Heterodermia aff. obscurata]
MPIPLRRLVEVLPNDTLHIFSYSRLVRLRHEDLKLLWKTQKSLTNLLFDFELDSRLTLDILREDSLELRSLVSISQISILFGDGLPDPPALDFLMMMADMFPNLRELGLECSPKALDSPDDGTLLPTTFQLSRCLPRTLTHTRLVCVEIRHANEVPLEELTILKHLELVECDAIETLLDNYSRPFLETFTYHHDCKEDPNDTKASTAVLEFLQRFQHLKRLIIDCQDCLTPFESIAASSIMSHAATLEHLLINCEPAHVEGLYEGSLLEAASKCKRLKQLGISFGGPDNIDLGVKLINDLPRLSTLNVYDLAFINQNLITYSYTPLFAQRIFNMIEPSSRLAILTFGLIVRQRNWMERREHPVPRQCFGRSKVNDSRYTGMIKYTAIPLDPSLVKYIEPQSSILEYHFVH